MKDQQFNKDQVMLDIEGKLFKTSRSTIHSIPGSLLSNLDENSPYFNPQTKTYDFDRDSSTFKHILTAFRSGEIHVPRNMCPKRFRKEMEFWGIPHKMIPLCCWKYYYEVEDDINTLNTIMECSPTQGLQVKSKVGSSTSHCSPQFKPSQETTTTTTTTIDTITNTKEKDDNSMASKNNCFNIPNGKGIAVQTAPTPVVVSSQEKTLTKDESDDLEGKLTIKEQSWKESIWNFLEEPQTSTAAKVWCFMYIAAVIVSVLLNTIWIDEDMRVESYLYKISSLVKGEQNLTMLIGKNEIPNDKIMRSLRMDPHMSLFIVDLLCTGIFGLETVVHFVVCPNKSRYLCNFYNVIKVVLCITMSASLVVEVRKDLIESVDVGKFFLLLKATNMLRMLLILRLRKLYNNFHITLLAIQRSGRELLLLTVIFGSTIIVYAGIMFCVEIETEMFPNTRTTMWWALITMTTIGYGDYYPTTTLGYIVGALCAINGLIVVALPIAAIASNFANICTRNADYIKHQAAIRREEESVLMKNETDCHVRDYKEKTQ